MASTRARRLRSNPTEAEKPIWLHLRNKQLNGFRFRRQQPIGPYIVDFFCPQASLVIEIHGGQHSPERDDTRTRWLEERGYRVVRFWNNDVLGNAEGVWTALAELLREYSPPRPSPSRGEEKSDLACLGSEFSLAPVTAFAIFSSPPQGGREINTQSTGGPMPKRTDIKSILIIGAGPIVIGQACEFDYSGAQACKALREEGYRIVLVNSNPATIMTDPEMADATYIEPITPDFVERIIAKEKPDALLPTMGGQTALNTAMALARSGVLARYDVELIGAKEDAIAKAEDRLSVPRGHGSDRPAIAEAASLVRSQRRGARGDCLYRACPPLSGLPSPWAAPAAALPTTGWTSI